MKFANNNSYKFLLIGFLAAVICMSAFFVIKYKKGKEALLSRVDYRIFACGKEIFLKVDKEDLKSKRNSLFARSESGSVIADGFVASGEHIFLSSFFETIGSKLEYTDDHKSNFYLQTENGVREFHTGDMCNGKEASFHLIHHRIETGTNPWSIYSRVVWKDKDYILSNNYGKVPPGDCFIFMFDSEDVLNRPWPTCPAHDKALANGELILEK